MIPSGAKRCFNCGTVLTGQICDYCELTPAAASVVLRRRLILRTGLFLLGSLAFLAAAYRFPPLELDGMLVFCGVIFFAGLALAVRVERGALQGTEIEIWKRLFQAMVLAPWLLAGLLVVNGRLDSAPVESRQTRVVAKFAMPAAMMPTRRLVVRSWRDGRRFERVAVTRDEYSEFSVGDRVVVEVHPGLAGIPWVGGVREPVAGGGSR
ncbi:MAG TPA: hypothetical protein VGS20_01140 [Candidatus Acidoferrales bacterium]|nr:hypothetical protein [Candidatus Acidoferrales bacterium]